MSSPIRWRFMNEPDEKKPALELGAAQIFFSQGYFFCTCYILRWVVILHKEKTDAQKKAGTPSKRFKLYNMVMVHLCWWEVFVALCWRAFYALRFLICRFHHHSFGAFFFGEWELPKRFVQNTNESSRPFSCTHTKDTFASVLGEKLFDLPPVFPFLDFDFVPTTTTTILMFSLSLLVHAASLLLHS